MAYLLDGRGEGVDHTEVVEHEAPRLVDAHVSRVRVAVQHAWFGVRVTVEGTVGVRGWGLGLGSG